jgi:hypothetical protein
MRRVCVRTCSHEGAGHSARAAPFRGLTRWTTYPVHDISLCGQAIRLWAPGQCASTAVILHATYGFFPACLACVRAQFNAVSAWSHRAYISAHHCLRDAVILLILSASIASPRHRVRPIQYCGYCCCGDAVPLTYLFLFLPSLLPQVWLPWVGQFYMRRVETMLIGGVGLVVFTIPLFALMTIGSDLGAIASLTGFAVLLSLWGAPMCTWMVENFPPQLRYVDAHRRLGWDTCVQIEECDHCGLQCGRERAEMFVDDDEHKESETTRHLLTRWVVHRFTAVAIGYNLAQAIFGGSVEVAATLMAEATPLGPAYLIVGVASELFVDSLRDCDSLQHSPLHLGYTSYVVAE